MIDTRLWPDTQLSGFAKKKDLPFFLKELAGISYEHRLELAPSEDILRDYKDRKISWGDYEKRYLALLNTRQIMQKINPSDMSGSCFLCAESSPHHCHRRLLVEYLKKERNNSIEIVHL